MNPARRFDRTIAYAVSLVALPILAFAGAHCSSNDGTPNGGDASVESGTPISQDSGSGDDTGASSDATVTSDASDDAPSSSDGAPDDGAASDASDAQGDDGSVDGGVDTGVDSGPIDAGPPTFTNVYTNVFEVYCTSCHGQTPPLGNSNFKMGTQIETYGNLVGDAGGVTAAGVACGVTPADGGPIPKRVVPGDAASSLLYHKVADSPPFCGERMPYGGAKLPSELILLIQTWINDGALDD